LAATPQAYEDLARQVEWIISHAGEMFATADTLHMPIPQLFARAWAEFMGWPAQIRETGARRAGTWTDPPFERHDEPETP
jgi:hypothetical protein